MSQLLAQGAGLLVGFVVTPIIVRGLGAELYGAWTMIQRSVGFVGLGNLSAMGALKLKLGTSQHKEDVQEKRRAIGAALILWGVTFPLLVLLGAGLVLFAPKFIHTASEARVAVKWTVFLMVLGTSLGQLLSLPGAVMRAQNVEYRAMGLNAAVILIGGLLGALAIRLGYGLVGLAVAALVGIGLVSLGRFIVARGALAWFGVAMPGRPELISFARLSAWVSFTALGGVLLSAFDLILVGILLKPAAAAIYAITGTALRMLSQPITQVLTSGNAGLAMLVGKGDWQRLECVRIEIHQLALVMMTVIGTGVLALNRSFLSLWVGAHFYGGITLTLLLFLIEISRLFFVLESVVVDNSLQLRPKSVAMFVFGIAGLILGCLLVRRWQSSGIAFGTLVSYLGLMLYMPSLVRRLTPLSFVTYVRGILRPVLLSACCLLGGYVLGLYLCLTTWPAFAVAASAVGGISLFVMWAAGVPHATRRSLIARAQSLLPRLKGVEGRL